MSPALCQWSEVMNHPGLVCCVQQTTGIPLVIMVKPDTFLIQEIKTLPAKAKVLTIYYTDVKESVAMDYCVLKKIVEQKNQAF